jgi:hypothetical protein
MIDDRRWIMEICAGKLSSTAYEQTATARTPRHIIEMQKRVDALQRSARRSLANTL